jgi:hypothetical protein
MADLESSKPGTGEKFLHEQLSANGGSLEELDDFARFAHESRPSAWPPKPKLPFLRRPVNCPHCGNEREISRERVFRSACGKALVARAKPAERHYGHLNPILLT